MGSIPGSGRSPREVNSNPLQYSSLGNPMDRGAWQATYSSWGHRESDTTEQLTVSAQFLTGHRLGTSDIRDRSKLFYLLKKKMKISLNIWVARKVSARNQSFKDGLASALSLMGS